MKYNRSEIMRNAWNIRRESGCTMSDALKKAWAIAKKGNEMFTEETLKNFIRRERIKFASREEALNAFVSGLNIPAITGRSDKQIKYARDLRDRMLYKMMETNSDEFIEEILDAMYIRSMSPEELAETVKKYNETAEEYMENYLSCTSARKIYLTLTECDAGNLIDGLR